ncbi:MAG: S8 family peptidase [Microscillaceae bacterium]|nr:S8 family peptidase [Microscillaceae bacterium]
MKINIFLGGLIWISSVGYVSAQQDIPTNWHHLDEESDQFRGVSTQKAYELLKGRKSKTVVVAVIDSGVEIDHDDLKGNIWTNPKEKPGNGIDDDQNGYVDDIHGWDFIGGKDGKDVDHDNYELTRIYVHLKKKYGGKNAAEIAKKDQKEFEYYQKIKTDFEQKVEELNNEYNQIKQTLTMISQCLETLTEHLGKDNFNIQDVKGITSQDTRIQRAKFILTDVFSNDPSMDAQTLKSEVTEYQEYFEGQLNYGYNTEFDPRSIVADNYTDTSEKSYGNNEVEGPDAEHGTHVSGIIAAIRGNDLGMDGIADNVRIMVIRTVPDGDERDKDVANAIRYAADNGARIINMSFGKDYSPQKEVVDEAVKYAEAKGVLLIHAAGNDSKDIDKEANYPNKYFSQGGASSLWIEVGASSMGDESNFVGDFSNYGQKNVDIFAPGVQIYSTVPDGQFKNLQGTSMAAPVVSGVAALLMSYFPDLSSAEIRDILMKSSRKYPLEVTKPGDTSKIAFEKLSVSGGIINAYEAVKMALSKSK